jgi:hypothetical protein
MQRPHKVKEHMRYPKIGKVRPLLLLFLLLAAVSCFSVSRPGDQTARIPSGGRVGACSSLLQITRILPNDDGVLVRFAPVAGAKDYRICPVDHPHLKKYSAGSPVPDRLSLHQLIDDRTPRAEMPSINGHGDPASVPNVIARSQSVHPLRSATPDTPNPPPPHLQ